MTKPNTVTVQVYLRVPVLCDVTVRPPNEEGQCDIKSIRLAQRGNFETPALIDTAALDESEYQDIDDEAAKVWKEAGLD